jgi:hypothetical protein
MSPLVHKPKRNSVFRQEPRALRTLLLIENGNGLNIFSDSTEFGIADFYASHQFELWLITTVVAAISLIAPITYRFYKRPINPVQTVKK